MYNQYNNPSAWHSFFVVSYAFQERRSELLNLLLSDMEQDFGAKFLPSNTFIFSPSMSTDPWLSSKPGNEGFKTRVTDGSSHMLSHGHFRQKEEESVPFPKRMWAWPEHKPSWKYL